MGAFFSWMCSVTPHSPNLYHREARPAVPADDQRGAGKFHRSYDDRLWLFSRMWAPPDPTKTSATLMIVHGTVDHSGVYTELAEQLASRGVAVFAADMRGWGRSDGERLYFNSMDVFVKDLVEDYDRLHAPGAPFEHVRNRFLLGKSIGGLIAAWAATMHPDHWTGLIGLSGAYKVDKPMQLGGLAMVGLRGLATLFPKLPIKQAFDPQLIVKDEAALRQWEQDPLVSRGKLTAAYILELLSCIGSLPARLERARLRLPVLTLWGTEDRVVTEAGHRMLVEASENVVSRMITYPGGFHNLLAEPSLKADVTRDLADWLTEVAAASPAGATVRV